MVSAAENYCLYLTGRRMSADGPPLTEAQPPSLPARQTSCEPLVLALEFSGGAELLVANQKRHDVKLPVVV